MVFLPGSGKVWISHNEKNTTERWKILRKIWQCEHMLVEACLLPGDCMAQVKQRVSRRLSYCSRALLPSELLLEKVYYRQ